MNKQDKGAGAAARGTNLPERLAEVVLDILLHRAPAVGLAVMLQHERRLGLCVRSCSILRALASPWFTFTPRKVLKAGERAEGVRAAEEAVQEAAGRGKGV
jgi:hypothetical protein